MPLLEDLSYEKRETKTLRTITNATNVDEALENALYAIYDARGFREYAKATGVDVVKKDIGWGLAAACFISGAACCLIVLYGMGVI